MWCDNCLLIFPLGAGAIVLGVILAVNIYKIKYIYDIYGPINQLMNSGFFFFD